MATVLWTGAAQTKVMRRTFPVGFSAGATYTLTSSNGKTASYTAVTGDDATSTAGAIAAAAGASLEPEFRELTVSDDGAGTVVADGPADGASFTLNGSATAGTLAGTTVVAAQSPNDLALVGNYSGGALPSNGDTLIFPTGTPAVRHNLTALSAITGLVIVREAGGPKLGLNPVRADGTAEFRATRVVVDPASMRIEYVNAATADDVRLNVSAGDPAVVINGGGGALNAEAVSIVGAGTNATVSLNGASVNLNTTPGGADVVTSVLAQNSAVRLGSGGTAGTLKLTNCQATIAGNWTTLVMDGAGAQLTVFGTATGALQLDGGQVDWVGTGGLANPLVGSGSLLNLDAGAGPVAVTGAVKLYEGGRLADTGNRLTRPYDVQLIRRDTGSESLNIGTHATLTVAAGP